MRRLPMRRRLKPMRQGDLDGLCGVYSIINAIRWLCPALSEQQAQELFNVLIDMREKRPMRRPLAFIYRGLTRAGLSRLASAATGWAAISPGITLEAEWLAPADHRGDRPAAVWRQLERHIGPGTVAIIGLGEQLEHWTVAVAASGRQLTLLDSDGMATVRRDRCVPRLDGGPHYDLQLRYVLVLRRLRRELPMGEVNF